MLSCIRISLDTFCDSVKRSNILLILIAAFTMDHPSYMPEMPVFKKIVGGGRHLIKLRA